MMDFLKNLFGGKSNEEMKTALANGAVIIDVRSEGEFAGGHIKGSKNIPLNKLSGQLNAIKKLNKEVVCVCASGMRSSQGTNLLNQNGVKAYNGGSWHSLN
jgi:rhodanese-related sulfurtransferase